MSANFMVGNDAFASTSTKQQQPSVPYGSFMADNHSHSSSIASSPIGISNHQNIPDFSRDNSSSNTIRNGSRRGRLFDLVDDGEDEFANADAMVSGMLLNIGMFQDSTSQEVNVEEISLMGIGNPTNDVETMRQTGRFG